MKALSKAEKTGKVDEVQAWKKHLQMDKPEDQSIDPKQTKDSDPHDVDDEDEYIYSKVLKITPLKQGKDELIKLLKP